MRTDLTNLMADISVACTLMCCCCYFGTLVGEIYDVKSTVLAGFGFRLSEGRDNKDQNGNNETMERINA